MPILATTVSLIDWSIVIAFLIGVVAFGLWVGRKKTEGKDFFLAGRNIPAWAAAISLVATALSAATFIGGPAESFGGNLSYLILNIGSILGGILAALWLIPAAYKAGGTTIYGLLGTRFGPSAQTAAGLSFLAGRLLASGARHFITGVAFSAIVFGDMEKAHLIPSILITGVLGTLYAAKGGVKAVIWTDILLFAVLMASVGACVWVIWRDIPVDAATVVREMEAAKKLTLLDWSWDWSNAYTVWAALASTLFYAALYGADQDLAQRMLTCRSPQAASKSLIMGVIAGLPLNMLFLCLGVALWVYYKRPDLMGTHAPTDPLVREAQVFPQFIREHLPVGFKGLAIAGLFACSLGSLASAISAMASSAWNDLNQIPSIGRLTAKASPRGASLWTGAALTGVAVLCALVYDPEKDSLIKFALKVMTFAATGLLGVFMAALWTKRGNAKSVICAFIAGAGVAGTLYFVNVVPMEKDGKMIFLPLAFPWVMALGTLAAFAVCIAEKGDSQKPTLPA